MTRSNLLRCLLLLNEQSNQPLNKFRCIQVNAFPLCQLDSNDFLTPKYSSLKSSYSVLGYGQRVGTLWFWYLWCRSFRGPWTRARAYKENYGVIKIYYTHLNHFDWLLKLFEPIRILQTRTTLFDTVNFVIGSRP